MKHICRRIFGIVLLLALLCGQAFAAGSEPFAVVLSWTDDPAACMSVSWRSEAKTDAVLQVAEKTAYDKTGFDGAKTFPADCKDISLKKTGAWHYEAQAADLLPGTQYCYRVGTDGAWSEVHTFTTDDPQSASVTLAYFGDVQPDGDSEKSYAAWEALAKSVYAAHPELSCAVLGGDMVNSGIALDQFDLLLRHAQSVFSNVPLFAVNGNHESNFLSGKPELYLDVFAFPANGPEGFREEFYSFDVGGCHIVAVNSWVFSGEQKLTEQDFTRIADWLKNDLASSSADWQIVVTHLPANPVHSDANAEKMKKAWVPIFEDYGVDLVLEGHQHVYSRSFPLYRGGVDYENGIVYVMGVSGSKFYDSADETLAERTIYSTATCQLLRADGDTLTLQTVDAQGRELDYAVLTQRTGIQTRLAYITRLWRKAGTPQPAGKSPFADTDSPAAAWAYESGLVFGYGNGKFGASDPITAAQIALIEARMEAAA